MSTCDLLVGKKHQLSGQSMARMHKQYEFRHSDLDSDTDGESGGESTSHSEMKNDHNNKGTDTSSQSAVAVLKTVQPKIRVKGSKTRPERSEWEIVEGLKEGQKCEQLPEEYQGYMSKKKRWPLKGWHKRFFLLEKGILHYGKSPSDIQKGKYHGTIDVAMSVLTFKRNHYRIDIDTDQYVYHIKIKQQNFDEWLKRLHHHRLYRQHEFEYGTQEVPRLIGITSADEDLPTNMNLTEKGTEKMLNRELSLHSSLKGQERVTTRLLDTQGFEHCSKALSLAQSLLLELNKDMDAIRMLPLAVDSFNFHATSPPLSLIHNIPPSLIVTPPTDSIHSSASNPNLHISQRIHPHNSAPLMSMSTQHKMRIDEIKLRESFLSKADQVHEILKMLLHSMSTERDRFKQTVDLNSSTSPTSSHSTTTVAALKQTLAEVCQQNKVLKDRLAKIHSETQLGDLHLLSPPSSPSKNRVPGLSQSFSAESCSMSEYYDAVENAESGSDSSSEKSDEEISSDVSDNDTEVSIAHSASEDNMLTKFQTGRRCKLPAPKPDTKNVSLWNILIQNIGKDLTKISMPVTLNEPLSMLQRLCEELEYSDLLDKANECNDTYERMIYIAAFAVSSYASSCYRIGHKPFNPLLCETYENIREDKGWRFISEQVSHHPPISACFCESKTFKLWQDVQIKTKFWGKSMEIQPLGVVNVILPKHKDHYKWNKVTTRVHNILGGQRWVDQFGEMIITNGNIMCKLTFTKGDKRHEVYGTIINAEGKVVHNLFGNWNEALYCSDTTVRCIWRPGAMLDNCELYYGFSRFAMELNEILPDEVALLPITDSRFRPDQRLVEEGKLQEAEAEKLRMEIMQRDKRKQKDTLKEDYKPMWFRKEAMKGGKYQFIYDNKYWECRKDPTFAKMALPKLW